MTNINTHNNQMWGNNYVMNHLSDSLLPKLCFFAVRKVKGQKTI